MSKCAQNKQTNKKKTFGGDEAYTEERKGVVYTSEWFIDLKIV